MNWEQISARSKQGVLEEWVVIISTRNIIRLLVIYFKEAYYKQ